MPDPVHGPGLLHHGDAEVRGSGLLDLAVNVHPHGPPGFLRDALRAAVDDVGAYPDAREAEALLARQHGRRPEQVVATAGATEAFTLLARWRPWRHPVVVHPQFTEPHAALLQAGHRVEAVLVPPGEPLDPGAVPTEADLVVLGNPTNPTGTLHPRTTLLALARPGRVVVVDEAFMDAVPGESESLVGDEAAGVVVVRSLTKTWSVPGVRVGYLLADVGTAQGLRALRPPWSVSSAAVAAIRAVATPQGQFEAARRATQLQAWRAGLEAALAERGVPHLRSQAPFVLARPGADAHARLREAGVAVRRCDTFPGLDGSWIRIAARPPAALRPLWAALGDT